MTTHKGVDLSHNNPTVDFGTLKAAGIEFVALKASEGATFRDDQFQDRRQRATLVGFHKRLYYHFVHPEVDAKAQAQNFLGAVQAIGAHEIVVLDVEAMKGWDQLSVPNKVDLINDIVYWLKSGLSIPASKVMLYGSLGWLRGEFGSHLADLTYMRLWAARYEVQDLGDTSPWRHETIWQNGEHGRVAGVGGEVDTDLWRDDLAWTTP